MQAATDRIALSMKQSRAQNTRRMRSSAYVVILLTALLWWTQWPSLQLGIIVLLLGQLATTGLYILRNSRIGAELAALRTSPIDSAAAKHWFRGERAFLRRLALVESSVRTAGFALLAYGFWVATRSTAVSVLLGVIYPLAAYFGINRQNQRRAITRLGMQEQELEALLYVRT